MDVADVTLAVALLGAAAAALLTSAGRRLIGAYVAFGLVLAAASLWLGAWEVAIAEVVVGAGVTAGLLWWVLAASGARAAGDPGAHAE